jgi:hypothetical protein
MFVAILGHPTAATAVGAFRDVWAFEIAAAAAAALVLVAVGPVYAPAVSRAAVPAGISPAVPAATSAG